MGKKINMEFTNPFKKKKHKPKYTVALYEFIQTEHPVLIIKEQTGVEYLDQCGGIACSQNSYEGFIVSFHDIGENFSDCQLGCADICPQFPSTQLSAAKEIDKAIKAYFSDFEPNLRFEFDFERVDELMENWWPVKLTGECGGRMLKNHPAIYTRQNNCD